MNQKATDLLHPKTQLRCNVNLRDRSWAKYFGEWLDPEEAGWYFEQLYNTILWENDVVNIFGRRIVTQRKVAWYGDNAYTYKYSGTTRKALPWIPELEMLRGKLNTELGLEFNSCLLNLYNSGDEGMGWHSDDEKELVKGGVIASMSLGASRPFLFKNKETKEKVEVQLENGSLLLMGGAVQKYWLHSLPKRKKIKSARINLTFRMIDTYS